MPHLGPEPDAPSFARGAPLATPVVAPPVPPAQPPVAAAPAAPAPAPKQPANPGVAAQINEMVTRGAGPSVNQTNMQDVGGMIYNGDTNALTQWGSQPTPDARIHDTGIDIGTSLAQIQAGLDEFVSRLNEVTYDTKTGKATHVLQDAERELLQKQQTRALESAHHNMQRLSKLQAQRNNDRAAEASRQQAEAVRATAMAAEEAEIARLANGNRDTEKFLKEEIRLEELRQAARDLVARRNGKK